MKACPACNATYEDWIEFCFADGQPLVAQAAAGGAPPPAIDAFDIPEPGNVGTGAGPAVVADADAPTARLAPLQRAGARVESPAETKPLDLGKPVASGSDSHRTIVPDDDFGEIMAPPEPAPAQAPDPDPEPVRTPSVSAAPRMVLTPAEPPVRQANRPAAPAAPRAKGPIAIVAAAALLVAGGGWFLFSGPPKAPVAANVDFPKPVPTKAAPAPEPPAPEPPAPEPPAPEPVVNEAPEPVEPAAAPVRDVMEPRKADRGGEKGGEKGNEKGRDKTAAAASPSTTSDAPWGAPSSEATTVGTLRVRSEPSGAKVFIDNKERGRTPLDVELPYGSHNVRVMQRNYKTEIRDVSIRLKELTVPFTLRPEVNNGTVTIYASGGARVAIDGSAQGPAPVTVTLNEGMHTFRLDNADGSTCSLAREVKFPGGGNASLNLKCP